MERSGTWHQVMSDVMAEGEGSGLWWSRQIFGDP